MIISIDFDGTIVYESWPEPGAVFPNAREVINELYEKGHTIVINTCRSGKHEGVAQDVLENNNINYHWINTNVPDLIHKYGMDCRKISADVYIDNKQLGGLPTIPHSEVIDWLMVRELLDKEFNLNLDNI